MSSTTTPGNSFLPIHVRDPALLAQNEHAHRQLHHSVEPLHEIRYSVAHPSLEHANGSNPPTVSYEKPSGSIEKSYELDSQSSPTREGECRFSTRGWYSRIRVYWHAAFFILATAWWITGLILHRPGQTEHKVYNWVVPFLLWLFVSIRLLTYHVSPRPFFKLNALVWNTVFVATLDRTVPPAYRGYAGGVLTFAVFLIGSMVSKETASNSRADRAVSLFGLGVFVAVFYATSRNRKIINWKTVQVGLIAQFLIALWVLRSGFGYDIFSFISGLTVSLLSYAELGFAFLFAKASGFPYFVVSVLPAIIFFIALVQLAYYFGVLQFFIVKFAVIFYWAMDISGAEAVAASAAPFLGQGENAILIKPFIAHLTNAEIHQIMTSGFATIAGSVFASYVNLGANPQALLSSTIMSIPASIAMSKLRYPETEETLSKGQVVVPESDDVKENVNALQAFSNGAWLGLKVAAMISGNLLVIVAFVGLVDGVLGWLGKYIQVPQLTLQLVLGYICYPIAFLLGAPRDELFLIGKLIGVKIIQNEFVAFTNLTDPAGEYTDLSSRGRIIATYAIAGFGNFASVGNQIGVFMQLAPKRSGDFARIALSALLTGITATLMSASIAGMVLDRDL